MKVSGSKYIFLVFYVDDILLAAKILTCWLRQSSYCLAILFLRSLGKHLMSWECKYFTVDLVAFGDCLKRRILNAF